MQRTKFLSGCYVGDDKMQDVSSAFWNGSVLLRGVCWVASHFANVWGLAVCACSLYSCSTLEAIFLILLRLSTDCHYNSSVGLGAGVKMSWVWEGFYRMYVWSLLPQGWHRGKKKKMLEALFFFLKSLQVFRASFVVKVWWWCGQFEGWMLFLFPCLFERRTEFLCTGQAWSFFFPVLDNVVMTSPHFNIFSLLYRVYYQCHFAKWCCTLFII